MGLTRAGSPCPVFGNILECASTWRIVTRERFELLSSGLETSLERERADRPSIGPKWLSATSARQGITSGCAWIHRSLNLPLPLTAKRRPYLTIRQQPIQPRRRFLGQSETFEFSRAHVCSTNRISPCYGNRLPLGQEQAGFAEIVTLAQCHFLGGQRSFRGRGGESSPRGLGLMAGSHGECQAATTPRLHQCRGSTAAEARSRCSARFLCAAGLVGLVPGWSGRQRGGERRYAQTRPLDAEPCRLFALKTGALPPFPAVLRPTVLLPSFSSQIQKIACSSFLFTLYRLEVLQTSYTFFS